MDFSLPAELVALKERTEAFVREQVIPYENDPRQTPHGPEDGLRRELIARGRAAGLLAPHVGREWGGLGLDHRGRAVVFEAAGYSPLGPIALNCFAPDEANMHLLEAAAEERHKQRWLRPLAAGEIRSCFMMTEPAPGAGADPSMLLTTARREGEDFVIDGRKWLITGAAGADLAIIMAKTESDPAGPAGATLFLVPMSTPGIVIERVLDTLDQYMAGGHAVVRLERVRVPASEVLGRVGEGFRYAQARLAPARLTHAMRWLGAARRAHDIAVDYARRRHAFGRPLGEHEGVGFMLADNEMDLHTSRLVIWHTAWLLDRGERARHESSMAKVICSEAIWRVTRARSRARKETAGSGPAGKEFVEQRVAHGVEIKPVRGDQRARLDDDGVDVADQFQPLVEVLAVDAEPGAEDLHKIDDLEAAPVAERADLAVAGVIDRGQGRDPGIGGGLEFALAQLALELGQGGEAVGLGADARHVELDEFDAGNDRQQLFDRCHGLRKDRPLVQRDALVDRALHEPGKSLGMPGQKHEERVQIERPPAEMRLVIGQADLAQLQLAARAPGQDSRGSGRREAVDRGEADARGVLESALAELIDPAALPGTAHDFVIDAEQVEDVEAEQRDVGRLQDVAAGIEDHLGRPGAGPPFEPAQPRQRLGRHLQPRQHAHAAAHRGKAVAPALVERHPVPLAAGKAAGELDHETGIDAIAAGRDAVAAAAAHLGPAHRSLVAAAAGRQIDDRRRRLLRVRFAEPGRRDHRTGPEAFAAAGAGRGNLFTARPELFEIESGRFAHRASLSIARQSLMQRRLVINSGSFWARPVWC